MTTFTPPINPSWGFSRATTPRVLTAGFGDGYRQESGDGLNLLPRTATPEWQILSTDDADTIENFFRAQKGYLAFDWTPPGESVSSKWKCTTWTRTSPTALTDAITATFEQVFDL